MHSEGMSGTQRYISKYAGPPVTAPISGQEFPSPILDAESDRDLANDVLDKVNAGARLVFAMHMHPDTAALFASPLFTRQMREAYWAAAKAWGI